MAKVENSGFIMASQLNSYRYLKTDADLMLELAADPKYARTHRRSQLARSAALLYIVAFEGLMNRALGTFLSQEDKIDFLSQEIELSTLDKLDMLLKKAPTSKGLVDKSRYPWSHLKDVISLRNDYVHPKFKRPSILEVFAGHIAMNLLPDRIPEGLKWPANYDKPDKEISRRDVVYDQTGLPRDPSSFMIEDAELIRKIVEDNIRNIDDLLGGVISRDGWIESDTFHLIYPPGKTFKDQLPPYPSELQAKYPV